MDSSTSFFLDISSTPSLHDMPRTQLFRQVPTQPFFKRLLWRFPVGVSNRHPCLHGGSKRWCKPGIVAVQIIGRINRVRKEETSANSTLPQPTRAARLPLLLSAPNLVYLINDVSISRILTARFIIPAVLIPSLFPCATPDGCVESGSINRIFSAANAASHPRRPFVRFPVQDAVLTISGPFPQSIRRP